MRHNVFGARIFRLTDTKDFKKTKQEEQNYKYYIRKRESGLETKHYNENNKIDYVGMGSE